MAVGECVFNKLNPQDKEHQLKFEYETNDDITALKLLARPIPEQEAELKSWWVEHQLISNEPVRSQQVCHDKPVGGAEDVVGGGERFGHGLVEAQECSDTDR